MSVGQSKFVPILCVRKISAWFEGVCLALRPRVLRDSRATKPTVNYSLAIRLPLFTILMGLTKWTLNKFTQDRNLGYRDKENVFEAP